MTSQSSILTAFNEHFVEFISDIQAVFPEDVDILSAKNSLLIIKKANPKMIIKIWKTHIVDKYMDQIEKGDISFFINKDYSGDLSKSYFSSNKIIEGIDRLRNPIREMTPENQQKTMKYIQNLTKLSTLYEN
jgi:accessory colonization factor AcfC